LERHGHDVIKLTDVLPRETADAIVFATAQDKGCVMITCNRNDYLDLAAKAPHLGLIILIRRRSEVECMKLLQLIHRAGEQGIAGNINFA
jgi:predicted nuclease of predicted toxin-antitoxin system